MVSLNVTPVHHAVCMVSFAWWTGMSVADGFASSSSSSSAGGSAAWYLSDQSAAS
jgi:hypothetical protein